MHGVCERLDTAYHIVTARISTENVSVWINFSQETKL